MNISIIIVTKNRSKELKDCLNSIQNQELLPQEIIVVDSSEISEKNSMAIKYPDLNIVYLDHFYGGMTKARNFGFKRTKGDIIVYIDDDVILHNTYLKEINDYFLNNLDVMAVTGPTYDLSDILLLRSSKIEMNNLLYKKDPFFESVVSEIESLSGTPFSHLYTQYLHNKYKRIFIKLVRIFFILDSFNMGKMLPSGFGSSFHPLDIPYSVERLNGCNMAFRKEVLSEFEFDESLEKASNYAIYEDHEYGYRISRKYRISMVPTIILCHRKTPTSRVDNFNYYRAIIINVYSIVQRDLGYFSNKIFFIWSFLGIMFTLLIFLLIKPNYENKEKLIGVLSGLNSIFNEKL